MQLEDLLNIEALLNPCQRLALSHMATGLNSGATIVEIGPYRGGSTKILHESAPGCELITIDIYDNIDRELFDVDRYAEFILGGVEAFRKKKGDKPIDLLFIDGDHSFYGVKHDFNTLARNLGPETLIAFHDYSIKYIGVWVFCNALIAQGVVEKLAVVEDMLLARFTNMSEPLVSDDYGAAVKTLLELKLPQPPDDLDDGLARSRKIIADLGRYQCIGKGAFGRFVANYFGLNFAMLGDAADVEKNSRYLVCSYWFDEISEQLSRNKGATPENIVSASDLLNHAFLADLLDCGAKLVVNSPDEDEIALIRGMVKLPEDILRRLGSHGSLKACFKRTSLD